MPRCTSVATLARVAGFDHLRWFIAGATARGALLARHSVARRSSAWPAARRARKSAPPRAPKAAADGAARDGLEGRRRHELARSGRHYHLHFGAALAQPPHEIRA